MIILKTDEEIQRMRESGHVTAMVLRELSAHVAEGFLVKDLDRIAETMIKNMGAVPAFKGYRGYPKTITVSINEQVVHGIPGKRRLKKGDIVSIDMGVFLDGYCSDAALTVPVGEVSPEAEKLIRVTRESFYKGVEKAFIGNRLGDVSHAIQVYAESFGFSVVRDLVGHGIGRAMHEDPPVPNYGRSGSGTLLKKGLVIAIEPMINAGAWEVVCLDDGWTVVTRDGGNSSHFEHTVALTEEGPRILTLPMDAPREEEYPFSKTT